MRLQSRSSSARLRPHREAARTSPPRVASSGMYSPSQSIEHSIQTRSVTDSGSNMSQSGIKPGSTMRNGRSPASPADQRAPVARLAGELVAAISSSSVEKSKSQSGSSCADRRSSGTIRCTRALRAVQRTSKSASWPARRDVAASPLKSTCSPHAVRHRRLLDLGLERRLR